MSIPSAGAPPAKAAVVPQSARHYRAVTPTVSPPDRLSPDIWRRACEQRGMMTTAQRMNELAPLHYEQVRQVHKDLCVVARSISPQVASQALCETWSDSRCAAGLAPRERCGGRWGAPCSWTVV